MRSRIVERLDLAQLEHERVADVALLDRVLAQVELPGLAVVVGEALRAQPPLLAALLGGERLGSRSPGSSRGPPTSGLHEFGS